MPLTKEKYHKNKDAGGCVVCGKERYPTTLTCDYHRIKQIQRVIKYRNKNREKCRKYVKERREKMKLEKRCIRCWQPLDEEMDKKYVKCLICRSRIKGSQL